MHEHYQNAGAQAPAQQPMADQAVDIQRSYAEGRIRRSVEQPPPSPSSPMLPRVVERVAMANDELRSLASMIGAFANRVMGSVPTTDGLTAGKTPPPRTDCAASTLSELQDEQQRLINQIRAEAFRLDGIA